jgi:hypothetical protein
MDLDDFRNELTANSNPSPSPNPNRRVISDLTPNTAPTSPNPPADVHLQSSVKEVKDAPAPKLKR